MITLILCKQYKLDSFDDKWKYINNYKKLIDKIFHIWNYSSSASNVVRKFYTCEGTNHESLNKDDEYMNMGEMINLVEMNNMDDLIKMRSGSLLQTLYL